MTNRRRPTEEELDAMFHRTGGDCHLCHGTRGPKLVRSHYGRDDLDTGWVVEHSHALAKGGVDDPRNWFPAHWDCNTEKGTRSSNSVRRENDVPLRAPRSTKKREEVRESNTFTGVVGGAALGGLVAGPPGALIGGLLGGLFGHDIDPK